MLPSFYIIQMCVIKMCCITGRLRARETPKRTGTQLCLHYICVVCVYKGLCLYTFWAACGQSAWTLVDMTQSMWVERSGKQSVTILDWAGSGFFKQLERCPVSRSAPLQIRSDAAHTTRWKRAQPRMHLCIAQHTPPTHTIFCLLLSAAA